jgi:hypothetical protein
MDSSIKVDVFHCTQCGGELHPDEGKIFVTCSYCGSTVYLDKSQAVFHWYLASTLDEPKARAELSRWMAGNQTVKDLDKKSRLLSSSFEYFPLWYLKRRTAEGEEQILLDLAAATSITEVKNVKLPAGDLRRYDSGIDSQAHPPTVPLQAVLGWLQERRIPPSEIVERALVHIPIYIFKYEFRGQTYSALVEAASGGVYANFFPAKAEAPYQLVAGISAVIFLCLASFPVVGAVMGDSAFGIGALLCVGLGVLVAPILFFFAAWVAAKV